MKKKKYIEANELPENEKIYLKKDWAGYRQIYPIKNEDSSINFINLIFGGKRNLLNLIIIGLICLLLYYGFQEQISNYKQVAEAPCDFCNTCHEQTSEIISQINREKFRVNVSEINFTKYGVGMEWMYQFYIVIFNWR